MARGLPSFWIKVGLTAAVAALADPLLFDTDYVGLNLGVFSLALVAALGIANPAIRRDRLALAALATAGMLAGLQIERATFLGWMLFALAVGVAALAPRAARGDDGWRWAQRLVMAALKAVIGPFLDLRRLLRARTRSGPMRLARLALGVALPVVGGVVFIWLFAAANPVIEQALAGMRLPEADLARLVFWGFVAFLAWTALRPRGLRRTLRTPGLDGELNLPGVTPLSVAASLAVFNVIFAVQNGLDAVFLWSGAGLPQGVSFSEYAHRGAEPLIATALLAGLFVVVFLRPGSPTAQSRPIRAMVVLWIAQNLFLVASTALRTLDYVEAYSLTRTRIAALLWMGLVALGLGLILWRLLRAKSASWLINANLAAVGAVLAACSVVDLGAVAAAWNVRHAREVGGRGVALDLCYMRQLGGAAVVSLAQLETSAIPADLRERVRRVRGDLTQQVAERNARWRSWRFRDARRLDRVERLLGPAAYAARDLKPSDCGGRTLSPRVAPPAQAIPPLTPSPKPGT